MTDVEWDEDDEGTAIITVDAESATGRALTRHAERTGQSADVLLLEAIEQFVERNEERSFSEDDHVEADCQQCRWSVCEPTRQAALKAAKHHRRATGHLVVLRK